MREAHAPVSDEGRAGSGGGESGPLRLRVLESGTCQLLSEDEAPAPGAPIPWQHACGLIQQAGLEPSPGILRALGPGGFPAAAPRLMQALRHGADRRGIEGAVVLIGRRWAPQVRALLGTLARPGVAGKAGEFGPDLGPLDPPA